MQEFLLAPAMGTHGAFQWFVSIRSPSITSVVLVVSHLVLPLVTQIYIPYLPYLQPRLKVHRSLL